MKKGLKIFLIIIAILIALALIGASWLVRGYNKVVALDEAVSEAWGQVETQLQRRYDLIPNLVETVKGYAKHEREVFEKVTQARSMAMNAGTVKEHGQAENMLAGALKSLFAVVENYPELKANQNFLLLQEELAGTEGKIAYARQFYNDSVMKFNLRQQVLPSNIVARMFNFKEKEYFEIEEAEAKKPVAVKF